MARAKNLPKGISRRADRKLLAQVWSKREQRRISKVFGRRDLAAAKAWRRDTQTALARGAVVAGESPTLRRASEMFLQGAEEGTIRTRSASGLCELFVVPGARCGAGGRVDRRGSRLALRGGMILWWCGWLT
jgi:hypothetical protein